MVADKVALAKLFGEGNPEALEALARKGRDVLGLEWEGLNLVSASVLADCPEARRLEVVHRAGALVPDPLYPLLFAHRFRLVHPRRARELRASGVEVTEAVRSALSQDWDLFDLLFAVAPLPLGGEILAYALGRGLRLGQGEVCRLKSCAAGLGEGSPREIDAYFETLLRG